MKITDLEKIDTGSMFKTYDKWPEISIEAFEKEYDKIDFITSPIVPEPPIPAKII